MLIIGRIYYSNLASSAEFQELKALKKKKMMKQGILACCKIYISVSRNASALEAIERAATLHPEAAIMNKFEDTAYNRVGYTLVSSLARDKASVGSAASSPLQRAAYAIVEAALKAINLEFHSGTHPRLGVVDHVCFHPLGHASIDDAAQLAKNLAANLGSKLQIPTFLYGAAHQEGRPLDYIRRQLGYFKPNSVDNQWVGWAASDSIALKPDEGPIHLDRAKGITLVGATPWVDNYNVPILSTDITAARRIARQVSGRSGGLPGVQAMALLHGKEKLEIACNLLEPSRIGGVRVQKEVERLAKEEGMSVEMGYFTDLSQEQIVENYLKLKSVD